MKSLQIWSGIKSVFTHYIYTEIYTEITIA